MTTKKEYYYQVAPKNIVRPSAGFFTYSYSTNLPIGTIVNISVGKKELIGIIVGEEKVKPKFKIKPITSIIEAQPLPVGLVKTLLWISDYYCSHLAAAIQIALPTGLLKKRRANIKLSSHPLRERTNFLLTKGQELALRHLNETGSNTLLLHGDTGSGKTHVYIEAAKMQLKKGLSSIILVPEISLTPQLLAEFAKHFNNLLVAHSGLTEAARHKVWETALNSNEPVVAIGPRSALFLPIKNIGLIVVDECHEQSYKQDQTPKYSALRVASVLAKNNNAKLIMGSATPSVTDYYLASATKLPIIRLQNINKINNTSISVVDLRKREHLKKHRFISDDLLGAIESAIKSGEQALIFHNRRGSTPSVLCESCGWLALCQRCQMPLTYHGDQHVLRCHLCGIKSSVINSCGQCHEPSLLYKGVGTKLIESELKKLFPNANIARFDNDNKDGEAILDRYQDLYDGKINIIIGTQTVAKGLDLPRLSTVGVIQADNGLGLPDFQSEERVFQLLYQVIGRAGRNGIKSNVVIQSYQVDHPSIQSAIQRNYASFYEYTLNTRRHHHFPPYGFLLKLTCTYKTEAGAINACRRMMLYIKAKELSVSVHGPTPSFYEYLGGKHRWQIVIKSKNRSTLKDLARDIPAGWQLDLDPSTLL